MAEATKELQALAKMVDQDLTRNDTGELDNLCMSAGQLACEVLAERGLLTIPEGQYRFAHWTEAEHEFLNRP